MGELCNAKVLFRKRRRLIKKKRARGDFPDVEHPSTMVVAHIIAPATVPDVVAPQGNVQAHVQNLPVPCQTTVLLANLRHVQFELEKTTAKLTRDTDGSSPTIPRFRELVRSMESFLNQLS